MKTNESIDSTWEADKCVDCGAIIDWELDEASTGGDTYYGTCQGTGCHSKFRAVMKAELDYVQRR